MAIDAERIMMQGRLAEAEEERKKLRLRAEGLCGSIRQEISPVLCDVEEMNIALVSAQMDELLGLHIDLLEVAGDIQRLKKALGKD